ncbi:MAG: putative signal peptide peptidase SppA [Elusimicrobia bacterium ADurb.Bin231]|nr:MAG: putative signal peptide peptidase SppA [Elusimicrobia bacterium ADurb.Bin231]
MERNRISIFILILFLISTVTGMWLSVKKSRVQKTKINSLNITQNKIAVVNVYGTIRASMRSAGSIRDSSEKVIKRLKKIGEDKSVKAVVLRINSPGGTVAAVQEIHAEILKLKKDKKVVVASFSDVAASGGYYIATAADKILANPGTLTGSIGVIMELSNFSSLMKKIGVKIETIKSGVHKDIGSFSREMTPEEKKILQDLINESYNDFVREVATGRKMDEEKVRLLADGRIFTGRQAVREGLVDMIGGLDDAIEEAKKLSGIKGKCKIVTDSEPWERFMEILPASFEESLAFDKVVPETSIRLEYMME